MKIYYRNLNRGEIDFLKDNLNLNDTYTRILDMSAQDYSNCKIAMCLNMSVEGLSYHKKQLTNKVFSLLNGGIDLTTIYINGREVTKDEVSQTEIKIERILQIIAKKLTNKY